jgi:hypothetical protein
MVGFAVTGGLLGRHVGRRAEHHPGEGDPTGVARPGEGPRNPEIGDHRVPTSDKYVLGLDVAVDDAMPVGVQQPLQHVTEDSMTGPGRHHPFALKPAPKGFAPDVGHDVVGTARSRRIGQGPDRQERNDAGVLEPGGLEDFLLEPSEELLAHQVGREDFDYHVTIESHLFGEEDPRHPTAGELSDDPMG